MKQNEYFVCTYDFGLRFLLDNENYCDLYKYGIFIALLEVQKTYLKKYRMTESENINNFLL